MKSLLSIIKNKIVIVSALGYFVDVFDLVLFGIVRVASLKSLGVPESEHFIQGTFLLNSQMAGMLLGGFAWGICGDRWGRMKALYGSILIYSLANLANAFVTNLELYALLRFVAGFGLAGELGAAVTLVSESVEKTKRGLAAAIIGLAGFSGAVCAALLGGVLPWQASYFIGGLLGLFLMFLRIQSSESKAFQKIQVRHFAMSHSLVTLFRSPNRLLKYVRCALVGVPIWFVSGILMYFAPEFAKELNLGAPVLAGNAIMWNYVGSILGDPVAGFLSQRLQSRKMGLRIFIVLAGVLIPFYFYLTRNPAPEFFYLVCFLLGIANGYWTLFVTMAAENFGTDIRATVTTSIPNLVRAAVIPLSALFISAKVSYGSINSGLMLGLACVFLALIALETLPETFSKDLNYLE